MQAVLSRIRLTEIQLLIPPSLMAIVGVLTVFLVQKGTPGWSWSSIWVSLVYVGMLLLTTILLSVLGFRGDQVLFPIVSMLAGLGLVMMQRLQPEFKTIAERQIMYLFIGLVIFWVLMIGVRNLDWLRRYKYTWAFGGIALMMVTLVFGEETNGARLWINLGVFTLQPDEILKIVLVIFFAGYLSEFKGEISSAKRILGIPVPPLPYLIPLATMWVLAVATVVAQNNLGSALLLFGILVVMLYVASGRALYVVLGMGGFAISVYLAYELFGRVAVRVQNWLNPWAHPNGAGYQQIQSDYAMSAGHLFGSGLGHGYPSLIPVVQTDYIFSAIGEEMGFLGTMAVLCLFLLLIARGFRIAMGTNDTFERLLAVGLTTTLALQTLIILGGVVRLIPLTGVTLPFISAGGSSLLTNFLIIALLLRISDSKWRWM